jgi:hypothetical protein
MFTAFRFRRLRKRSAALVLAFSALGAEPLSFELLETARSRHVTAHNLIAVEVVRVNGSAPVRYEIFWQNGEKMRKGTRGWERIAEVRERTNAAFAFGKFEGLDGGFRLRPPRREGSFWLIVAEGHHSEWRAQRRRYWVEAVSGRLFRYECEIVRDGAAARKGSRFRYEYGADGLVRYESRFSLSGGWVVVKGDISEYRRFRADSVLTVEPNR